MADNEITMRKWESIDKYLRIHPDEITRPATAIRSRMARAVGWHPTTEQIEDMQRLLKHSMQM